MRRANKTLAAIAKGVKEGAELGFRRHLGGSVIGRECWRQVWYMFRWFRRVEFDPRVLRLFGRGHREEAVFIQYLEDAGIKVLDRDPDTGEQFRVSAHEGHFGGSLDSVVYGVLDWLRMEWLLGEYKTYNKRRFKELVAKGVKKTSPEYYAQLQVYMHLAKLPAALFLAVCKDNDELHAEIVAYQPTEASAFLDKALRIILAKAPPHRINESPAWFKCKWCDYNKVCHHDAAPAVNCRTCVHSEPRQGGTWACTKFDVELDEERQLIGCVEHTPYQNV